MKRSFLLITIALLVLIIGCEPESSCQQLSPETKQLLNDAEVLYTVRILELPEPAIVGDIPLAATDIKIKECK